MKCQNCGQKFIVELEDLKTITIKKDTDCQLRDLILRMKEEERSNATGKKISYVNVSEEEAKTAMKEMGMDDWLVNEILELCNYFKKGYASQVSSLVEEITGKKPISMQMYLDDTKTMSVEIM